MLQKLLRRGVRRAVERLWHVRIERFGDSILLLNPRRTADVWCSYELTLERLVREQRVTHILDVGANVGQFATTIRRFFDGRIDSFEPVRAAHKELVATSAADPQWRAHQLALGRDRGTLAIHVSPSLDLSSALSADAFCVDRFGPGARQVTTEEVPMERLDAVLPSLIGSLSDARLFLKLDTQGYDLEVFAGLGDLRDRVVLLQSELSLIPLYQKMPHWTDSVNVYERAGFAVVGLFPVNFASSGRVIEYDAVFVAATNA